MLKTILLIAICFLTSTSPAQSIYTYSVVSIEGSTTSLSTLQGKKILVITLPIQQSTSNDSLLHSLDSISTTYTNTLKIIAVPAYEDGYTAAIKDNLKQWYRSILGTNIIVTEGLYTRKTSGTAQHPLFNWLTDKTKNGSFNNDIDGPRNKFIVWANGELTSVMGAPVKASGTLMNQILQAQ